MDNNDNNHIDPLATPRHHDPRRALRAIRKAWKEQIDLQERLLDVTRH